RTVFVSTHLISEFEGVIDEFTIIDGGRELLTMEADEARSRFRKFRARFSAPVGEIALAGALRIRRDGRNVEVLANGSGDRIEAELRAMGPEDLRAESLSLEEIFVAAQTVKEEVS